MLQTWTTGESGQVSGKGAKDIDEYNKLHDSDSADGRNASYVDLVNSYYNLATDFYEWGWGQSFHFAEKLAGESFKASIARHEYYLAMRLGVQPSDHVLDCGCGIGGLLRIGQFTNARITGVTLNQYQVDRGNAPARRLASIPRRSCRRTSTTCPSRRTPRPLLPIEVRRHSPDRADVYGEIYWMPRRVAYSSYEGASPTSTTRTTLPTYSRRSASRRVTASPTSATRKRATRRCRRSASRLSSAVMSRSRQTQAESRGTRSSRRATGRSSGSSSPRGARS